LIGHLGSKSVSFVFT